MRDQVFISYSHLDEKWLLKLRTHLKPFERTHQIEVWDDTRIQSGDRWRDEIERALEAARVAVLLVSPDYLASDFVVNHELPPLLAAAEREGLRILWVAVSASAYLETPIKDYQAVNDPARPLDSLKTSKLNEELVEVCEAIRSAMSLAAETAPAAAAAPRPRQPRPRPAATPAPAPAAPPPEAPTALADSGQRPISRHTLERVLAEHLAGAKEKTKPKRSARRYILPVIASCLLHAAGAGAWLYFGRERAKPLPPLTTVEVNDEFINTLKWTVPPTGWSIDKSSGQGSLVVSNQPQVGYLTGVAYADFNADFNLKLLSNRGAAWAARVVDEKNYYLFYLSGPEGQYKNRFVTYIVRDGKIDPRSEQTTDVVAELKEGQFYEIDIVAEGNMITTTMTPDATGEKVMLGSLIDSEATHPRGSFGFLTVQGEKFSVDDFFIRPPNIQKP